MEKGSLSSCNGTCVEGAGFAGDILLVRDSEDPQGRVLKFTTAAWHPFIDGVHIGKFDRGRPRHSRAKQRCPCMHDSASSRRGQAPHLPVAHS
jgi:hypothetical protein